MNTPATAHEALIQCELLWKELARTGSDDKHTTAFQVLQYRPIAGCPACAYDVASCEFSCSNCPIDAWRRNTTKDLDAACVSSGSPFNAWLYAETRRARRSTALRILELIRASEAYSNVP